MTFHGVIPALITPFDEQGRIYARGLDSVIEFELGHGVNGFFVLGSAGQGPLMSPEERKSVTRMTISRVAGRVPVVVHVGAIPTATAVDLARDAALAGADGLAAAPPTYYRFDAQAIFEYFETIAVATDLPLLIYNNPMATNNPLTGEAVKQLATIPRLVGVKEASGQMATLAEVLSIPSFTVLIANADFNLIALCLGAVGSVSTIALVVPEFFAAMQEKLAAGDLAGAVDQQRRVTAVARSLRTPMISALHEGLRLRGVDAGYSRRPLRPATVDEVGRIRSALVSAGIL